MWKEYLGKTGMEGFFCRVHAQTFEKTNKFRHMLDNPGDSEIRLITI